MQYTYEKSGPRDYSVWGGTSANFKKEFISSHGTRLAALRAIDKLYMEDLFQACDCGGKNGLHSMLCNARG